MKNKKMLGNFILLFTALIWGMAFSYQSQAGAVLGAFTVNASRMTFAAVEIGILCLILDKKSGRGKQKKTPDHKKYTITGGIICGVFLACGSIFQQVGIGYTSVGKAGFITALYILFVPILAAVFFKKKIILKVWIAVFLAVAGMYFLTLSSAEGIGIGDVYVFVCAVFFSLQILAADVYTPKGDPIKIAEIQFIVTAVISWVLAFAFETPDLSAILSVIGPLLYCGCISGGIGYTLQMVGQRYADPTPASLCMSFESVFSVLGGMLILHEMLSRKEVLGCAIMFFAIILVQLPEKGTIRKGAGS